MKLICLIRISALAMMFMASITLAQEGDGERDPFHPSGGKPAVSAPLQDDWGRDPFSNPLGRKPAVQQATPDSSGSQLTGIIYSKQARLAIIDGEVLREGGMIGGKRLVGIRRKSVVLMDESGRKEELFLEDFSIRK